LAEWSRAVEETGVRVQGRDDMPRSGNKMRTRSAQRYAGLGNRSEKIEWAMTQYRSGIHMHSDGAILRWPANWGRGDIREDYEHNHLLEWCATNSTAEHARL
jgi:hypothetical protein